jgi:chaperonin GroEL
MTAKIVRFREDVWHRILHDVSILAYAVRATLGPRGRNVVIDQAFGAPAVTKDGVSR